MNPARRRVLATLGLAAAYPGLAGASVVARTEGNKEQLAWWYERPAGP